MIRTALIFLLVIAIVSCQDKLKDSSSVAEITFENSEQAFEAVGELYSVGAPAFYGEASTEMGPIAAIGGYLSGYFDNESKSTVKFVEFCQKTTYSDQSVASRVKEIWSSAYNSIEKCNVIIANLSQQTNIDDKDKVMLIAEARFFRTFNYFFLVRYFGEVPLVTGSKGIEGAVNAELSELYDFMIAELEEVIPNLSDEVLRISAGIAKTVLCDIYLTASGYPLQRQYYSEAARIAREVISSGAYTLAKNDTINNISAYRTLYNQGSEELIYSYTSKNDTYKSLSFSKSASSWGVLSYATNNAYRPVRDYIAFYDTKYDLRAKEGEFFHSFHIYEQEGRTIVQSYEHSPCIWLDGSSDEGTAVRKSISIYRYAEVLLLASEAIVRSEGVTSEAVEYLSMVRERAYPAMDRAAIISEVGGMNTEQFVQEIWRERLREFPFEMKIWSDIQRTRKYPVVGQDNLIDFVSVIGVSNPFGGVYNEQSLLLPIP